MGKFRTGTVAIFKLVCVYSWSPSNQTLLKDNLTLIIFFFIYLDWFRIGFYNPIYKNEFFLPKLTFLHHLKKMYMAFYLLT